jgi:hypothetical protein
MCSNKNDAPAEKLLEELINEKKLKGRHRVGIKRLKKYLYKHKVEVKIIQAVVLSEEKAKRLNLAEEIDRFILGMTWERRSAFLAALTERHRVIFADQYQGDGDLEKIEEIIGHESRRFVQEFRNDKTWYKDLVWLWSKYKGNIPLNSINSEITYIPQYPCSIYSELVHELFNSALTEYN